MYAEFYDGSQCGVIVGKDIEEKNRRDPILFLQKL